MSCFFRLKLTKMVNEVEIIDNGMTQLEMMKS